MTCLDLSFPITTNLVVKEWRNGERATRLTFELSRIIASSFHFLSLLTVPLFFVTSVAFSSNASPDARKKMRDASIHTLEFLSNLHLQQINCN